MGGPSVREGVAPVSRDKPPVYRISYNGGGGEDAGTLPGAMARVKRRYPLATARPIRNLDGSVSWWVYRNTREVGIDAHVALIEEEPQ